MNKSEEFRNSLKPKQDIDISDDEISMLLGKDFKNQNISKNKNKENKKILLSSKNNHLKFSGSILTNEEIRFLLRNDTKEDTKSNER